MPEISIIIPYYNNPDEINRLLLTIPNDNRIEVIIIDDHSSIKRSFDIASNVKWYHQDNKKKWAGAARNKGLSFATGKYITFADSDDIFLDGAFPLILSKISEQDIVFFKPISQTDEGYSSNRHVKYAKLIDNYIQKNDPEILFKFHVPWSKIYKRSFLVEEDIKFDEVIAANDVMFSLKASLSANKIDVFEDLIYCVTESNKSLTKTKTVEVLESRFKTAVRYNDYLISLGHNDKCTAMAQHINNALRSGKPEFLRRLFFCLKRNYPIFENIEHFKRVFSKTFIH